MPSLNEIRERVQSDRGGAQDRIRREYFSELAKHTGNDTIIYASAFDTLKASPNSGIGPEVFSIVLNDMQGFMSALHGLKGTKLDLILHSPGGSLEAAEQIVNYLRSKYDYIRAIVPQNAMSAATMIACACNEIVMGKHSAIGPIDPQITYRGFTAPAQAILDEFNQIKQEVQANPNLGVLWVQRVLSYPHGFLEQCRITIELAKEKVADWLELYMFQGQPNARQAAQNIAKWLGTATNHKTHGRPINIRTAQQQGLKVMPLETDQSLQEKVLSLFHATKVTFDTSHCAKLIENHEGQGSFVNVQVERR